MAIRLLTVWRTSDKAHWRPKVAQRLAEIAAEVGPGAVEQAALGLTEIAGMFLEMYANRITASPPAMPLPARPGICFIFSAAPDGPHPLTS